MALPIHTAYGELLREGKSSDIEAGGGYLLSDQQYYDLAMRDREAEMARQADASVAGVERSGRQRLGSFLTAQGLGDSSLAARADQGLASSFTEARARARRSAQMQAEEARRRAFAERDRRRAEASQKLANVTNVEAGIASAIPFAGQYASAGAQALGAGMQGAFADAPYYESSLGPHEVGGRAIEIDRGAPLETVDFGTGVGYQQPRSRTRGGGGSDFYRNYGY